MSSAPRREHDFDDKQDLDELDDQPVGVDAAESRVLETQTPVKRGRGRPKGSKNKNTVAPASPTAAVAGPSGANPPRKRGRPPKEKKEDDEPAPKRKRGRPPKNPKPADAGEPAPKKKRGRPPKKAAV